MKRHKAAVADTKERQPILVAVVAAGLPMSATVKSFVPQGLIGPDCRGCRSSHRNLKLSELKNKIYTLYL
jgi:hypothetical protein